MKAILTAVLALAISTPAFAHHHHPKPPPKSTPDQTQHQQQGQEQGQQQGQTSRNTNRNTSTSTSTSTSGADASMRDSGNTSVGISGDSYSSDSLFLPPVVPPTPPASVPGADVAYTQSACGPRMVVEHVPVYGTFFGLMHRAKVELGTDDLLTADAEPYRYVVQPDGSTLKLGHRVLIQMVPLGVAASRNLALGGGNANGWGQGGGGSSSSMQRLVNRIVLMDCEVGTLAPKPIELPPRVPRG